MKNLYLIICVLLLVSCKGNVPESQIVAQVGNSILTVSELRMQTPMGLTGTDSAAFVNEYIDGWIDQRIMYEQGMRNLPDIDQLNAQAENYRHNLIAQSYENELLKVRANNEISIQDIQDFYDRYSKQLRLDHPIIQGVYVKLLQNTSKLDQVRRWMKSLNAGDQDIIPELDEFGNMRAVEYDNFYDQWVDMYQLSDKLPVTVVDAASFLKCKTYEMKDDQYYYLFVIRDYRLAGEIQPFEYAKSDVYDVLMHQRRQEFRRKLIEELREEGMCTGFVRRK